MNEWIMSIFFLSRPQKRQKENKIEKNIQKAEIDEGEKKLMKEISIK